MKTEPKQAVAAIKLPVHVVPAKFGPIGRDINDASGKYVATAYIPEGAAQIAHALNSLPGVMEKAKLAVDAIRNSPTEPSSIVLQAANDLDAALSAAEKGMV